MTKLLEWLAGFTVFASIWLALITGKYELPILNKHPNVILYSPIILLGLFGIYSIIVILYRTLTFNTCEQAAIELKEDIRRAHRDLGRCGFTFTEDYTIN